ncbi:MAG: NosD domain-containing protein [Caldilineaceae bacterium]
MALTVLLLALQPTAVFAQDTSQISGTVYHDVAGTAITNTFTLFETPAKVSLFTSRDYITSTYTDASGHYTFTGLSGTSFGTTYYVTVDNPDELAGFSDGSGVGLVDQTYGSSGNSPKSTDGPVCAGASTEYAQQNGTSTSGWRGESQLANNADSGPCFGGRDANMDFVDLSGNTSLPARRYITKVSVRIETGVPPVPISGVDFAFSRNVVTNLEPDGAGSMNMFIRSANAISGTNTMRFVPVVAPNVNLGTAGKEWWRLSMTGTNKLPTITGDFTTIDGTAHYYRDGTIADKNQGNIFAATTVGTDNFSIAALGKPELEILEGLGANEATLDVQANNVTIRQLAFSNEANLPATASYHIRQNIGSGLTVEDVVMGYDMNTNAASANRTLHGIQTAYTTATTGTGTFRHNYIASNLASILLSNNIVNNAGNVVAATLGDWTVEQNVLTGGLRLGGGTDRILIRNNKFNEALIMAQSPGVNTAVGNNTVTNNTIVSLSGDSIRVYESDGNTITNNVLHGSADSGVSITSGGTGNRISQNSFQSNQGNAIDLGDNGVTTATSCTGAGGANGEVGRPVISNAKLSSGVLTVSGTYCNTGTFDIEFYKAHVGAGDTGSDTAVAGEGSVYLGKLGAITGGSFANQTITVPITAGLQIGDKVTALAINTTKWQHVRI